MIEDPIHLAVAAGIFLAFWLVVLAVSHALTRDRETKARAKPLKRVTLTRSTPPERFEHFCVSCNVTFIDPPHEDMRACPRCGSRWAHSSPVVASVPTPEEPPTLPTGGRAA